MNAGRRREGGIPASEGDTSRHELSAAREDLTGRDRMAWNVAASWIGHSVFIVAGFVMPRMIDSRIGQSALGIWDFSWSLVSYFGLAGIGVGSSVNRYVAKYRAASDVDGLNRAVTSVMCVQLGIALIIGLLTAGVSWWLPSLFGRRLGADTDAARWVVATLGTSLAVQMAFDTSRGVITGCHRWDLHNALNAGSYGLNVVAMIIALEMGGGIRSLGWVYLAFTILTELTRYRLARRVCPELRTRFSDAGWAQARSMIAFGGKAVISGLPPLLLTQASSLLVAAHLGPAALAVFSRPSGLVRNAQTFINKFAFVLTPTAGSLQGSGKEDELRTLLVQSTRFAVAIALPIVLLFAIQGNLILHLWMGTRYEQGGILGILAFGYFLPMTQQPAMTILIGINKHGRIGLATLLISIAAIVLGISFGAFFGFGLVGAALLVAVPLTLGSGIAVAVFACRRIGITVREYAARAFLAPAACAIPYAAWLVAARQLFAARPWIAFGAGCVGGAIILGTLYWRYVLPENTRAAVRDFRVRRHGNDESIPFDDESAIPPRDGIRWRP